MRRLLDDAGETSNVMSPELLTKLTDPGYTPGRRELPELFQLLESDDEELAVRAERALARAATAALEHLLTHGLGASPAARRGSLRLCNRLASASPEPRLRALLLSALSESDLKTRRNAITALGKWGRDDAIESALLERWPSADLLERRSLVASLGRVGGARSLELLGGFASDDAEAERLRRRALVMLGRSETRSEARLRLDTPLGRSRRVVLFCKAGLAPLLAREIHAWAQGSVLTPWAVAIEFRGSLRELLQSRLALDLGIEFELTDGRDLAERVVDVLTSEPVLATFRAWTDGQPRFRLAWSTGGHRRELAWAIAERVAERSVELRNDPVRSGWEVRVDERRAKLWLMPRGFTDPRFAYRHADVPAASHPTVAAALALAAGVKPDEIVWDPFCGSGLELIERARLGPYRRLIGSDVTPAALEAARRNVSAAGLAPELVLADARRYVPSEPVGLILTNPPMGRRVSRGGLEELLVPFVHHAARVLAPGGRCVWLSPIAARTKAEGQRAGLQVRDLGRVDLGGFTAELQTLRK